MSAIYPSPPEWLVDEILAKNPTRMPDPEGIAQNSPRQYPLGIGIGTQLDPFMRDKWPQIGVSRSFESDPKRAEGHYRVYFTGSGSKIDT